jgi:hypothetical protein
MNRLKALGLFLALLISSILTAQDNVLGLKTGTRLTYAVVGAEPGNSKTFVVTIKSISEDGITYAWENGAIKGTVILKNGAINSARRIQNAYNKSSKLTYSDKTSIFLSRQLFKELTNSGSTSIQINGNKTATAFNRFMERDYDILVNGKKMIFTAVLGVNQDIKDKPRVVLTLKDASFPLLLGMDLDFRIALKSIDNI